MSTVPAPSAPAHDPDLDRPIDDLIRDLVPDFIPDAEVWKNTPNLRFGLARPVDLIGTPQEEWVRNILRAAKQGMFS